MWTAVYSSPDTDGRPYIKRFQLESSAKRQNFLSDQGDARMLLLTSETYPRISITFGGGSSFREPQEVDVDEFIAVKGVKARGKRLTNYEVATIEELEPLRQPENENDNENENENENGFNENDNGDGNENEKPDEGESDGGKSDEGESDGGEPDGGEPEPSAEKTEDEIRDELNGQLRLF